MAIHLHRHEARSFCHKLLVRLSRYICIVQRGVQRGHTRAISYITTHALPIERNATSFTVRLMQEFSSPVTRPYFRPVSSPRRRLLFSSLNPRGRKKKRSSPTRRKFHWLGEKRRRQKKKRRNFSLYSGCPEELARLYELLFSLRMFRLP